MKRMRMGVILMGGLLLAAPGLAAAFTAANGAVADVRTGLIWQQQDDGQERNWEAAIAYCEGLSLAGQSDWRLPNSKELESITDDGRYDPSIDPIFTNAQSSYYWSSTTVAISASSNFNYAWAVDFYYGYVYDYNKLGYVDFTGSYRSNNFYVRCVRGGQ